MVTETKGRFQGYECAPQVKTRTILFCSERKSHTTNPSLHTPFPSDPLPGSSSASEYTVINHNPIHAPVIHPSDHCTLTNKPLFTHQPKPLDELSFLDVSLALPKGPALCLEGKASGFDPMLTLTAQIFRCCDLIPHCQFHCQENSFHVVLSSACLC